MLRRHAERPAELRLPVAEAAWHAFHARLRAFVARRVASLADAEDIVQQVFLRLHASRTGLRSGEAVGAWLFQATRNAIVDHYRAPSRRRERAKGDTREIDLRSFEDAGLAAEPGEGSRCAAQCLRPLVARLPAAYRRAIERVELEGRTQAESARLEGLTFSGMKARVQRARKRLRALLLERCRVKLDARGGVTGCEAPAGPACETAC